MNPTSLYPVLMSDDVAAAADFYRAALDATTTFETDWYVSLQVGRFELAVLQHDHPTIPEGFRALPSGVLLNVEVEDVDRVHDRFTSDLGLAPVLSLRSETFGQRHFIVAAPDGVLLDVIQPIEPGPEHADAFAVAAT
ncbi:VOC family protein [Aeromicrobium sp. Leaf350]|uniref:VOC family protein n=1 Tax=Aeromicrobium sp. Leaf350 TaxID=2876565 RepID=UPI001E4C14AB|nr:VOC family protein [Aeromicrobium sp. Leaf350]